jgi:hypothetical protein
MAQPQQTVFPLTTKSGVKRDGTVLDGNYHVDSQWARWVAGRARKMGGYRLTSNHFQGPVYPVLPYPDNGTVTVTACSATAVQTIVLTPDGFGGGVSNRTPTATTSSWGAQNTTLWSLNAMYDSSATQTLVIAHPGLNLTNIDNSSTTGIFTGTITSATVALTLATDIPKVSGGAAVLHPFLFVYGSAGYVAWSDPNQPTVFTSTSGVAGAARIAENKVVYGAPTRGGGQAPAGLFWTMNSLVRATFTGGAAVFSFDTISDETSILSSRCVIEYDGLFYWIANDRFLVYNGVVQELPNLQNLDWFFNNLNWNQRQKVWATKVPRYGEIWWHFPYGNDATECNRAIIYNVREKTWYDSEISRSGGWFPQDYRYPLWADSERMTATNAATYSLWNHEVGTDRVEGPNSFAIESFFETADVTFAANGPGGDGSWTGIQRNVKLSRVEPDFVQTGDMLLEIIGRKFARSDEITKAYPLFTATTEKIDTTQSQFRELRTRWTSNVAGGYFEEGQILLTIQPGDTRP